MNIKRIKWRSLFAGLITVCMMGAFAIRLMQVQIVDAEEYKKELRGLELATQVTKATRGNIVDRNGLPLATNRMGYDVVVDKAFFPGDRNNEIILELTQMFTQLGESWIDNLPITATRPFQFLPDRDEDVARVKKFLGIADYSTAEYVLSWMAERYGTEDFSPEAARTIAGVRYEMEQRGFNLNVTYTFATDVSMSTVVRVKEQAYRFTGVDVIESASRVYPNGTIAPHLTGLIGPIYAEEYPELKEKGYALNDVVGKSGAEGAFEDYLRGQNGTRQIYFNPSGQATKYEDTIPPVPGETVVMTLDSRLQQTAQEALPAQIKYLQENARAGEGREATYGAVAMVECKTGKVLTSATYPSYDLNEYRKNYSELARQTEAKPLLDRSLMGAYAPGSTFKPVVATAGLGTGVVGPGTTMFCGHSLVYLNHTFTCLGYHGNINVIEALRQSCNIYFYEVGRLLGNDFAILDETAKQYGLGEPTGIELNEVRGRRSNPETKMELLGEEWYPGDVLQSSIGQLYHQFTPLQLANYAATIGNRGTRMKLTFVDEIRDYSMEKLIEPFKPVVADRVAQPDEAFESVVRGMVAASRTGTARAVFGNYPIDVASKTGTPETRTDLNSVFICFAPAEDPEVAIAVVIEKGFHGYTGAPVAKALLDEYFGFNKPSASEEPEALAPAAQAGTSAPYVPVETPSSSEADIAVPPSSSSGQEDEDASRGERS